MNTLSWFLYFASIVEAFKTTVVVFGVISAVAFIVYAVIGVTENVDWVVKKRWLAVPIVLILLAAFIPTRNTLYAIAVSEVGEQVLISEVGKKAQSALLKWIDDTLNEKTGAQHD